MPAVPWQLVAVVADGRHLERVGYADLRRGEEVNQVPNGTLALWGIFAEILYLIINHGFG